ncbi:hypothetical protein KP509_15G066700 [Ceratopteris richardii]|uniref:Transcription factor MYC/MYB N-terminal domain-containing protein n=1 Tax=Ceratopteris richardii TaxID=49495 RepID=A0A8T2TAQ1_CERRI|nr:hypothetical protein KP509_15G066700 [Ceratopteris richardii]KAH7405343.1 hypothetical protein KP509_15G066700 [Ceratopteris richardii]
MEANNGGGFYRFPLCSHLLQQSLRSFCTDSQWTYAVFWRILPRNFPPPKWEIGGYLDRTKANKRNWILVWEDGFCDFAKANATAGLQPDQFFKMSHEVYNYGEGLMGKISAENGHKWVHKDPSQADSTPSWQNTIDPQPRTWEPQFKAGIQSIVVIAVREGLVQLGSTQKIPEDVNFVALLQTKFNGLLVSLSASAPTSPLGMLRENKGMEGKRHEQQQAVQRNLERQMSWNGSMVLNPTCQQVHKGSLNAQQHLNPSATIMPSMNSLQALLSKLPAVTSPPSSQISQINTSNLDASNANLSLPYHASPLIRSLSAPQGDFWFNEAASMSPSSSNMPVHLSASASSDPNLRHQRDLSSHVQQDAFMRIDSGSLNAEEYTYMNDLMGG